MDFKKPIHLKIKEFFLEDKSEEGRKLLAQEKRKISKHMKEM